jgi:hypothetical protein
MVHETNITFVVLSKLRLVFHIEFMLHSLYSFFAHNLKKFLKFSKPVKTLETKRLYLLDRHVGPFEMCIGPI